MTTSTKQHSLEDRVETTRAARVAAAVSRWQRRLSELGGRNALLWFRDLPDTTLDLTGAHPAGLAKLFSSGLAPLPELVRQQAALTDATRRARTLSELAGQLYADHGIATCYLASGLARWRIPGSARTPVAPVLLRPCAVERTGKDGRGLAIRLTGGVGVNGALAAYLDSECGIALDEDRICALAAQGSGSDPRAAYDELRAVCADLPDLRIDPRLVVGLFATVKVPLIRDLAGQRDDLVTHDVVAALAGDPDAARQVGAQPPEPGECDLDRERLAVDADLDQQGVVEAARAGAHLVVEGPPGTGRTQTAANLVAALAADGRRTLLVSPKRAAIDAVRERLEQARLGDLLLDLHGPAAAPDRIAAHLVGLLDQRRAAPQRTPAALDGLLAHREQLRAHVDTMHRVRGPWGVTIDEAQSRVTRLEEQKPAPRSRVRLTGDDLAGISGERRDELQALLRDLAEQDAWTVTGDPDPWFGARVVGSRQLERTAALVAELAGGDLAAHRARLGQLCDTVGLPAPKTMRHAQDQLDLMAQVHSTLETFRPEVFEAPLGELAAATGTREYRTEHGIEQGGLERHRLRKQAQSMLRPGTAPRGIHPVLVRAQGQEARWREAAGPGSRPAAPVSVPEIAEAHQRRHTQLEWLGARLDGTPDGSQLLDTDFDTLERRLAALAARPDRLAKVPTVVKALDRLRANGLGPFIDDVAARQLTPDQVATEFDFVWWTSLLAHVGRLDAGYAEHNGPALRRAATAFIADDTAQIRRAALAVHDAVAAATGRAARDLPDQVQLLRECAEAPGQWPRDLLRAAPELIGTLTPCWAMSPLEVPAHVPPGLWFDVVVFDEGSLVDPAEAIPAISRAGQVVVLGDSRQLPPADLQMTAADDAPPPRTQPQSLMDALAPLVPLRSLGTHYRSRDERLIAFAGTHLYGGRLETFPGTVDDGVLRLDVVSGSGRGGESSGPEVDRVVQLVLDQLRKRPDESLGVITLTRRHAQRIQDALHAALAGQTAPAQLLHAERTEPFFVTSVEHAQGSVRDAIILTIGYGRGPDGQVPHRFGALSAAGGECRLGVAMTRARRRMVVVSSFSGGELDPGGLRSRGATMLRDFLLYAASGGSARRVAGAAAGAAGCGTDRAPADAAALVAGQAAVPPGAPVGPAGRRRRMASTGSVLERPTVAQLDAAEVTPLVADLARRLRAEGLVVRTAHGSGRHRVDLAVEDPRRPGTLLMAIETDGPAYASIDATRDRDRLRVQQLERLGWAYERVWTRDLFRDPAKEVARLLTAVHAASNARRRARHG